MALPIYDLAAARTRIEEESLQPITRLAPVSATLPKEMLEAPKLVELPAGWQNAIQEVLEHAKPDGAQTRMWRRTVQAVWRFAVKHAGALIAAGWTFDEIFGAPRAWVGSRGAVWLEQGLLEADHVEIAQAYVRWRAPNGAILTKWRRNGAPGVRVRADHPGEEGLGVTEHSRQAITTPAGQKPECDID